MSPGLLVWVFLRTDWVDWNYRVSAIKSPQNPHDKGLSHYAPRNENVVLVRPVEFIDQGPWDQSRGKREPQIRRVKWGKI
jgi:hypothetical protein